MKMTEKRMLSSSLTKLHNSAVALKSSVSKTYGNEMSDFWAPAVVV